jgi:hypothetical protein
MTLKIAVDNTNVEQFPNANVLDIAAVMREFADRIDAGEFGELTHALFIYETAGTIGSEVWGELTTMREAIGTFDIAKAHFLEKVLGQ